VAAAIDLAELRALEFSRSLGEILLVEFVTNRTQVEVHRLANFPDTADSHRIRAELHLNGMGYTRTCDYLITKNITS
jgi:hypothetical protein